MSWHAHSPSAAQLPPHSCRPAHPGLCAVQPELHSHLEVHTRRDPKTLPRFLTSARAAVEIAEPKVTVSDERTHTEFLRQRETGGVVLGNRLGVERLDAGRNLGEDSEPQRLIRSLFVLPRWIALRRIAGWRNMLPLEHEGRTACLTSIVSSQTVVPRSDRPPRKRRSRRCSPRSSPALPTSRRRSARRGWAVSRRSI